MASERDTILIHEILHGKDAAGAWTKLVDHYKGRLRAFFTRHLKRRDYADDLVQETFNGLFTSLKTYDQRRDLQSYLFSIAHFKLVNHFRKHGRESGQASGDAAQDLIGQMPSTQRTASSDARSKERRELEAEAVRRHLGQMLRECIEKGDYLRVQVLELLWVKGMRNRDVAQTLGIGEGQVANIRFAAVQKLNGTMRLAGLAPEAFPELYDDSAPTR
jgi:RNA polymerase sigma-70 factor (ECF subfamily)